MSEISGFTWSDYRHYRDRIIELEAELARVRGEYQLSRRVAAVFERERDEARREVEATKAAVVHTIGGTDDEGNPTNSINYLQRLRKLVDTEKEITTLREGLRNEIEFPEQWGG